MLKLDECEVSSLVLTGCVLHSLSTQSNSKSIVFDTADSQATPNRHCLLPSSTPSYASLCTFVRNDAKQMAYCYDGRVHTGSGRDQGLSSETLRCWAALVGGPHRQHKVLI